jgi:hypothetical protein
MDLIQRPLISLITASWRIIAPYRIRPNLCPGVSLASVTLARRILNRKMTFTSTGLDHFPSFLKDATCLPLFSLKDPSLQKQLLLLFFSFNICDPKPLWA